MPIAEEERGSGWWLSWFIMTPRPKSLALLARTPMLGERARAGEEGMEL